MSKTLLAIDDSATMRKVLEITFSGEDFRVISAENRASALAKMSEEPNVVVIDTSLPNEDAYALAKEIRARDAKCTLVLLASRYNPYDANKGRDAGADDYMDKPFDTQQIIDKVKKAIVAHDAGAGKAAAAATPPTSTAPSMQSPFVSPTKPIVAVAAPPAPPPPPVPQAATKVGVGNFPAATQSRTHTLSFEGTPPPRPVVAAPPVPPAPPAINRQPSRPEFSKTLQTQGSQQTPPAAPVPAAHAAPPAPPHAAAANVGAQVNGQLAGKLGDLGLTPAQADAVLALSREVVERVVWEVVPQLAETMIKEEIARLMKDG